MTFRDKVRRALAAPLGGPLGRILHVPAMTAIVADGRDGDDETVALAELIDALVRVGVPRGRQFVLLACAGATAAEARERTRELREALGVPVLAHDPVRRAGYAPTTPSGGTPLELDDELREAEEVVLVGRCAPDAACGMRGGPAALWPGLASAAGRAAHAATLPSSGSARRSAAWERAIEALERVPSAFALLWNADDPPVVRAGETLALLEACTAAGWLDVRARSDPAGP